jgi:hypothetical protein
MFSTSHETFVPGSDTLKARLTSPPRNYREGRGLTRSDHVHPEKHNERMGKIAGRRAPGNGEDLAQAGAEEVFGELPDVVEDAAAFFHGCQG